MDASRHDVNECKYCSNLVVTNTCIYPVSVTCLQIFVAGTEFGNIYAFCNPLLSLFDENQGPIVIQNFILKFMSHDLSGISHDLSSMSHDQVPRPLLTLVIQLVSHLQLGSKSPQTPPTLLLLLRLRFSPIFPPYLSFFVTWKKRNLFFLKNARERKNLN